MSDYMFLFDLDSTISRQEILPTVSARIGKQKEIRDLTEAAMRGEIPFKRSFLSRVELLKEIDVSEVNDMVSGIPLNVEITDFILRNKERCFVLTGNLDVWISGLMERIGLKNHVYCSRANVKDDRITDVISVVDKELMSRQFVQPLVVIGDGDNDSGMARNADIAIGFGGVRKIAPSLLNCIDYAFYDDRRCADFLETLL